MPSLLGQVNGLRLSINRQNNFTFSTLLDLRYQKRFGDYELEVDLHHDNIINTSRLDDPFVQFYIRGRIWQHYHLNKSLAISSWIESDQFFHSSTQRVSIYGGVTWRIRELLEITPLVGYSWDYLGDILSTGFSPALRARVRHRWPDGLSTETDLFARAKFIDPRFQQNFNLRSQWSRGFGQEAQLLFGLLAGSNQMDTYRAGSIEKIKADTLEGNFNWRYNLGKGLDWEAQNSGAYSRRRFDYALFTADQPEFNNLFFGQLQFLTRQKISLARKKWQAYFLFEYQHLNRRYAVENNTGLNDLEYEKLQEREKQKDFRRNENKFEIYANWQLRKGHQLRLVANNWYLQYDSPSEVNTDDHDELNYGASVTWLGDWSRTFRTEYRLIGSVRRYAFLLGDRSQDNYTQHSLRMDFTWRWQVLPNLTLSGEQFVYVTYNVKDFVDRNFTDRSTRNLETRLIAAYRPSPKLQSTLNLYRKEIQVNYLNWEEFSETSLDTTTTYQLEQTNRWETPWLKGKMRLFLDMGYKHVTLLRYFNTAMNDFENILQPINLHIRGHQTGPVTGFKLSQRNGSSVELWLWWQFQVQDYKYKIVPEFTTISASYDQGFLQSREVLLRPFFRLDMNLSLGT